MDSANQQDSDFTPFLISSANGMPGYEQENPPVLSQKVVWQAALRNQPYGYIKDPEDKAH